MAIPIRIYTSVGEELTIDSDGRLKVSVDPLKNDVSTHTEQAVQTDLTTHNYP